MAVDPLAAGPSISSINPDGGTAAGGVTVTISGSKLTGTTAVNFGAVAAANFVVLSDATITAHTPAQAEGIVDVTVTTPGGTSNGVQYTNEKPPAPLDTNRFTNVTATIVAGEAISDAIDCTKGAPIFIHMPKEWTPARLTFLVSPDGVDYNDLFDTDASEISFNIQPGTSMRLDDVWAPINFLKIRSGPRATPRFQDDDRVITVTIKLAV